MRTIITLFSAGLLGCATLPMPTLGGRQLWRDLFVDGGCRIQQHQLTGHFRLLDRDNIRRAWGSYDACRQALATRRGTVSQSSDHLVLLVHGLGRSRHSMSGLERGLRAAGYRTESVNYPSLLGSLDQHASQLEQLLTRVQGVCRVSFVTHSLGGLVVRKLLARNGAWRKQVEVARVLMIMPPNQGSYLAELLRAKRMSWMLGPVGPEVMRAGAAGIPPPDVPFAIIAGGRGDADGRSWIVPGDDDGTVGVEETRLAGSEDFLVLDVGHTFGMNDPLLIAAAARYLHSGRLAPQSR